MTFSILLGLEYENTKLERQYKQLTTTPICGPTYTFSDWRLTTWQH